MALNAQLGIKTESTYATAAAPVTTFTEFEEWSTEAEIEIDRGDGYRATGFLPGVTGTCRTVTGYKASMKSRLWSVGFGTWLYHALGAKATTGSAPNYTHTFTMGTLCDLSFTAQDNVPLGACGTTNSAQTLTGCKVASWSISQEANKVAMFEAEILASTGTTATALATPSYAAAAGPFCWAGLTITVGGVAVPVKKWKLDVDNKLKDDRYLSGQTGRAEPVRFGDQVEAMLEFEPEWSASTFQDAALSGSILGPFVATLVSGSQQLVVTVQSFDLTNPTRPGLGGRELLAQEVKGQVLQPASGQPITIAYTTTDATVT